MRPLPILSFLISACLMLTAVSAEAATPTLKLHVDKKVVYNLDVRWLTPQNGGNDDISMAKIYKGSEQGDVDITRVIFYKNANSNALRSTIDDPGEWRLEFSGFWVSCKPVLQLIIQDGSAQPPTMTFTAKGNKTSSTISVTNPTYSKPVGAFKVESDGSITVTYPWPTK